MQITEKLISARNNFLYKRIVGHPRVYKAVVGAGSALEIFSGWNTGFSCAKATLALSKNDEQIKQAVQILSKNYTGHKVLLQNPQALAKCPGVLKEMTRFDKLFADLNMRKVANPENLIALALVNGNDIETSVKGLESLIEKYRNSNKFQMLSWAYGMGFDSVQIDTLFEKIQIKAGYGADRFIKATMPIEGFKTWKKDTLLLFISDTLNICGEQAPEAMESVPALLNATMGDATILELFRVMNDYCVEKLEGDQQDRKPLSKALSVLPGTVQNVSKYFESNLALAEELETYAEKFKTKTHIALNAFAEMLTTDADLECRNKIREQIAKVIEACPKNTEAALAVFPKVLAVMGDETSVCKLMKSVDENCGEKSPETFIALPEVLNANKKHFSGTEMADLFSNIAGSQKDGALEAYKPIFMTVAQIKNACKEINVSPALLLTHLSDKYPKNFKHYLSALWPIVADSANEAEVYKYIAQIEKQWDIPAYSEKTHPMCYALDAAEAAHQSGLKMKEIIPLYKKLMEACSVDGGKNDSGMMFMALKLNISAISKLMTPDKMVGLMMRMAAKVPAHIKLRNTLKQANRSISDPQDSPGMVLHYLFTHLPTALPELAFLSFDNIEELLGEKMWNIPGAEYVLRVIVSNLNELKEKKAKLAYLEKEYGIKQEPSAKG